MRALVLKPPARVHSRHIAKSVRLLAACQGNASLLTPLWHIYTLQAPVVADLTPKGLEMSDVSKYVRTGDRIVEVAGQSVLSSTSVGEVEQLLVGAQGSAVSVRLLRPFPCSDVFARNEMLDRKPENQECEEGVMYYINAVRWCPYLGQGNKWDAALKERVLSRPTPPRPKPSEDESGATPDMYIPHPLEAPQRATRKGLVYVKGQGYGLPTDSGGWDMPHAVATPAPVTNPMSSQV